MCKDRVHRLKSMDNYTGSTKAISMGKLASVLPLICKSNKSICSNSVHNAAYPISTCLDNTHAAGTKATYYGTISIATGFDTKSNGLLQQKA